jgi:8-oxo-dGTP diphosphatase
MLVNADGWILMQERDASAPIAPNKWGLVGGHVEANEDFAAAAYRELAEETGADWKSGLTMWFDGEFQHSTEQLAVRVQVWVAPTDLTDPDIVLGEGRQIVFVDPAQLDRLALGEMASSFVPALLESATYADLVARAASMAASSSAAAIDKVPADGSFDTPSGRL